MKKIICVNDLAGVGRSGLSVVMPVISALGVQCCPLPTAALSSHTGGFSPISVLSDANFIKSSIEAYSTQGIKFDAIYTGYLYNKSNAEVVEDYLSSFKGLKIVDPVMADNGKLYSGFDSEMVTAITSLCYFADIITPNATEAAILLGEDVSQLEFTELETQDFAQRLRIKFGASVIITGVPIIGDTRVVAVLDTQYDTLLCDYIDCSYPGTGDLFASCLAAMLTRGKDLKSAASSALKVAEKAVKSTYEKKTEPRFGLEIESIISNIEEYIS